MTRKDFIEMFQRENTEFLYGFLDYNAKVVLGFRPHNWTLKIEAPGVQIFPFTGFIKDDQDYSAMPENVSDIIWAWLEERFEEMRGGDEE